MNIEMAESNLALFPNKLHADPRKGIIIVQVL